MIDFIALGNQSIAQVPGLRCVPAVRSGDSRGLYVARTVAACGSSADWVCFVDGNEDVLADDFVPAAEDLARRAFAAKVPIAYMAETIHGAPGHSGPFTLPAFVRDHQLVHHGVVCSTAALRAIQWPLGYYAWEVIAYGVLAQQGFVFDPAPRYDWRPGPGGARRWAGYMIGLVNSKRWLQGLPVPKIGGGA